MAQSFAYVRSTMALYKDGVPCGQELHGVPKLLQLAYFIPAAACTAPDKGKCSGSRCKTNPASGPAMNGTCVKSGNSCVCQAD